MSLITLKIAPLYSSVPVSQRDSENSTRTVKLEQLHGTRPSFSVLPTVTSQNVFCEKGLPRHIMVYNLDILI